MIEAVRGNSVKLMIAYRLHFEAGNLEAVRIARNETIAEARFFSSEFAQRVAKDNVRITEPIETGNLSPGARQARNPQGEVRIRRVVDFLLRNLVILLRRFVTQPACPTRGNTRRASRSWTRLAPNASGFRQ
jgi:hypothetical protein